MAYIYKITNQINGKIYIGKTMGSIESRWQEHVRDSNKKHCKNRPLYRAFNKYGIDKFSIEIIEQCDAEFASDRECYWIEYYGSFKYGYNATKGGDGKQYCDYDLVYALYDQGLMIKDIVKITNYSADTCRIALDNFHITAEMRKARATEKLAKVVLQIDKDTDVIIRAYPSITEAYRALNKPHSGHIAEVCTGKRKTAYGYKWRYN